MEERIIDDEYGRGIRLKKTENGYVDATDELAEQNAAENAGAENAGNEEETAEEVIFEFPEEDDEELAALTFEEAQELRRKREEERKAREEKTRALCAEGEKLLAAGKFEDAAKAFDGALNETPADEDAAAGFWRAKTEYGKNLSPLLDEWAAEGYEQFASVFGQACADKLCEEYGEIFAAEAKEREEKILPLRESFEKKTSERGEILKRRVYRARKSCIPLLSLEVAFVVFALIFALNIFSRSDAVFVWLTAISGGAFVITLPFFVRAASEFFRATSLARANEKKSSTEEGRTLEKLENEEAFLRTFSKAQ